MSHSPLPVLQIDRRAYERGLACVHCGLCLAACPTYIQTHHEADSPRGRIQLIRGLVEGKITSSPQLRNHLDLCLDCRACEPACPSNVVYHELIEEYRIKTAGQAEISAFRRLALNLMVKIATRPRGLRLAALPLRLVRPGMLPPEKWWPRILPEDAPGKGKISAALFAGCVTSILFASVNRKAVELMALGGAEVSVPKSQLCCGALHYHNGDRKTAESMARRNIDAFANRGNFIISTAAGCGAMLREYDLLLRDDPVYSQRAAEFSRRVRDITEVLADLELPTPRNGTAMTATYHDACHLAHAQRVTAAPRKLLGQLPGLKLTSLPESDHCCGAAGTYFLTQPDMAATLADRKLANIASTGASVCAMGNPGCALHLRRRARATGKTVQFAHPVELLYGAYFPR